MHGFIAIIDLRTVYVEVPDWTGPPADHPGWPALCKAKALEDGLITEEEAVSATFRPSAPPPKPAAHWR